MSYESAAGQLGHINLDKKTTGKLKTQTKRFACLKPLP